MISDFLQFSQITNKQLKNGDEVVVDEIVQTKRIVVVDSQLDQPRHSTAADLFNCGVTSIFFSFTLLLLLLLLLF